MTKGQKIVSHWYTRLTDWGEPTTEGQRAALATRVDAAIAEAVAAQKRENALELAAVSKYANEMVALAIAEEREACARVCETLRIPKLFSTDPDDYYAPNGKECATAIRARDEQR